jgi:hypothetical protein
MCKGVFKRAHLKYMLITFLLKVKKKTCFLKNGANSVLKRYTYIGIFKSNITSSLLGVCIL